MKSRQWLFAAPAVLAVLAAAGCGGNSCDDAVKANARCAASLGGTPSLTAAVCNGLMCTNKQGFIDCVVGLQCGDRTTYNPAYQRCAAVNGCP